MTHIFSRLSLTLIFILALPFDTLADDKKTPAPDELARQQVAAIEKQNLTDAEKFQQAYQLYQQSAEKMQADAPVYAEAAYRFGEKAYGEDSKNTARLQYNYGYALLKAQKGFRGERAAYPALKAALESYNKIFGNNSAEHVPLYRDLCVAQASQPDKEIRRENYCDYAVDLSSQYDGKNSVEHAEMLLAAGNIMLKNNAYSYKKASKYIKEARDFFLKQNKNDPRAAFASFDLGKYQLAKQNYGTAKRHFETALHDFEVHGAATYKYQAAVHAFLVETLEQQGKSDEATQHCQAIGKLRPAVPNKDYQPIFRKAPNYPRSAAASGIEGYAIVEFTIDANGRVKNPVVIETEPESGIFVEEALRAVVNFRYAPRFVDGKPVDTKGVPFRINFRLVD